MPETFGQIDPPQRLLMGPGPVNAHPRVLRAMAADMLGQFDPEMTAYMNEAMALYRPIFGTQNKWTMLIDGTARARSVRRCRWPTSAENGMRGPTGAASYHTAFRGPGNDDTKQRDSLRGRPLRRRRRLLLVS